MSANDQENRTQNQILLRFSSEQVLSSLRDTKLNMVEDIRLAKSPMLYEPPTKPFSPGEIPFTNNPQYIHHPLPLPFQNRKNRTNSPGPASAGSAGATLRFSPLDFQRLGRSGILPEPPFTKTAVLRTRSLRHVIPGGSFDIHSMDRDFVTHETEPNSSILHSDRLRTASFYEPPSTDVLKPECPFESGTDTIYEPPLASEPANHDIYEPKVASEPELDTTYGPLLISESTNQGAFQPPSTSERKGSSIYETQRNLCNHDEFSDALLGRSTPTSPAIWSVSQTPTGVAERVTIRSKSDALCDETWTPVGRQKRIVQPNRHREGRIITNRLESSKEVSFAGEEGERGGGGGGGGGTPQRNPAVWGVCRESLRFHHDTNKVYRVDIGRLPDVSGCDPGARTHRGDSRGGCEGQSHVQAMSQLPVYTQQSSNRLPMQFPPPHRNPEQPDRDERRRTRETIRLAGVEYKRIKKHFESEWNHLRTKNTLPPIQKSIRVPSIPDNFTLPSKLYITSSGQLPHGPEHWLWEFPTYDPLDHDHFHGILGLLFTDLGNNLSIRYTCNIMRTYLVSGDSGWWIIHQDYHWRGYVGNSFDEINSIITNYDLWTTTPMFPTTEEQKEYADEVLRTRAMRKLSDDERKQLERLMLSEPTDEFFL
jgi:hypothetical protein